MEGKEGSKSDFIIRRRNVAAVQLKIITEAKEIAEKEGVPYFGLVVIAQKGAFPGNPTDVDRDPIKEIDSELGKRTYFVSRPKKYDKELLKGINKKIPVKVTYTLHPTVNLYVPRGE
jgi:hypothetical protein